MKIYRPLWSEGAFLAPQQFQRRTRWDAYVADVVAHMFTFITVGRHQRGSLMKVR